MRKTRASKELPTTQQLREELRRVRHRSSYSRVLRSTIYTLITVAAVAILVATLWLPVLQIYGSSMEPTLTEGDIVLSLKGSRFEPGDVVAFYTAQTWPFRVKNKFRREHLLPPAVCWG